jgi:hypothetical protein
MWHLVVPSANHHPCTVTFVAARIPISVPFGDKVSCRVAIAVAGFFPQKASVGGSNSPTESWFVSPSGRNIHSTCDVSPERRVVKLFHEVRVCTHFSRCMYPRISDCCLVAAARRTSSSRTQLWKCSPFDLLTTVAGLPTVRSSMALYVFSPHVAR